MEDLKEILYKRFNKDLVDIVLSANKLVRLHGRTDQGNRPTNIDYDFCIMLYEQYNLPMYKIAMLHGVSDGAIIYQFRKRDVNMKGHKCGRNSHNKYFETIDSIDKAYFLGLLTADGNIYQDRRSANNERKILQIALTESDKYILETFCRYANIKTQLKKTHKEDEKPRYALQVFSAKLFNDLYNLGLRERKSTEGYVIPELRKDLIIHYIRGYFDGDGIAHKTGYIGFCGALEMMEYIKSYFIKTLNVNNTKITFNKANNIYYAQWSSKKDIVKIFNLLYDNKQDLYLTRKYHKLKNVIGPLCSDV